MKNANPSLIVKGTQTPARSSTGSSRPVSASVSSKTPVSSRESSAASATPSHQVLVLQKQYIKGLEEHIQSLETQLALLRDAGEHRSFLLAQDSDKTLRCVEQEQVLQRLQKDLKRRETTMDFMASEREKLKEQISELEDKFKAQKSSYLEEIFRLQRENENLNSDVNNTMKSTQKLEGQLEQKEAELAELEAEKEELKCQVSHAIELTKKYKENIESLQADLTSSQLKVDVLKNEEQESFYQKHKEEMKSIQGRLRAAEQNSEHERHLRLKIEEEYGLLQQKVADLEIELSMTQGELEEVRRSRQNLEDFQSKIITEVSDIRAKKQQLQCELEVASIALKRETEQIKRLNILITEEEQRRLREEEKVEELEKKLQELERILTISRNDNHKFKIDNVLLREQLEDLKKQIESKESELGTLREKVQEMRVCVQEFQQQTDASTHLQSQRWRQLIRLAEGIRCLGEKAVKEHEKEDDLKDMPKS